MTVTSISKKTANSTYPSMKSDTGATYSVEMVGPDRANEMLAHNLDNRRIRKQTIDRYARDMKAGNWNENGAAISFAVDGTLIDGQHRLAAIVKSGVVVRMLIVRGLPNSAQDTIDDGAKRTMGDTFDFHQFGNATQAAAITRRILMWEQGHKVNNGRYQPTKHEALAAYREDHSIAVAINAATQMRSRKVVSPSITGLTWWLFWNIDEDACSEFWESLHRGVGLEEDDPIFIVREQIARYNARSERVPETAYLAWIIKAWNHTRDGKRLRPTYKYTLAANERIPDPR